MPKVAIVFSTAAAIAALSRTSATSSNAWRRIPAPVGRFPPGAAHRQRIAPDGKIAADVQRRDIGPLAGHQHGVPARPRPRR